MTRFSEKIVLDDLIFPECLRWHDGQLWFVDMYDGRLLSLCPGGELVEHYKSKAVLGGIILSDQCGLLVTDKYARHLIRGDGSVFADLSSIGNSPLNDAIVLPDGQVIVGEYGFNMAAGEGFAKGNLYAVDGSGNATTAATGLAFPNGMAISPDGQTLYVAETMAARIAKFAIGADGSLLHDGILVRFDKGHPDGLSIDRQGGVWAALLDRSAIVRIECTGVITRELKLENQPFDLAVGVDDATLYVGTSRAVAADLAQARKVRTGQIRKVRL